MRTLVIDCATEAMSLALFEDDRCIAGRHDLIGRGHAEALVPAIAALPESGRADAISVDVGPGSFTGIRVGIAAARALGFVWSAPVRGYSALSLCALIARQDHGAAGETTAVVMTGGHGELFWQLFEGEARAPMTRPASTPIAVLAGQLGEERVYGSGAAALIAARGWGEAVECLPDARAAMMLAAGDRTLPPVACYGRGADATPLARAGG